MKRPYGGVCYRVPFNERLTIIDTEKGGAEPRPYGEVLHSIAMQPFVRVVDAGMAGHTGPALRTVIVAMCHSTNFGGNRYRAAGAS